jgi:hypothetical protein
MWPEPSPIERANLVFYLCFVLLGMNHSGSSRIVCSRERNKRQILDQVGRTIQFTFKGSQESEYQQLFESCTSSIPLLANPFDKTHGPNTDLTLKMIT